MTIRKKVSKERDWSKLMELLHRCANKAAESYSWDISVDHVISEASHVLENEEYERAAFSYVDLKSELKKAKLLSAEKLDEDWDTFVSLFINYLDMNHYPARRSHEFSKLWESYFSQLGFLATQGDAILELPEFSSDRQIASKKFLRNLSRIQYENIELTEPQTSKPFLFEDTLERLASHRSKISVVIENIFSTITESSELELMVSDSAEFERWAVNATAQGLDKNPVAPFWLEAEDEAFDRSVRKLITSQVNLFAAMPSEERIKRFRSDALDRWTEILEEDPSDYGPLSALEAMDIFLDLQWTEGDLNSVLFKWDQLIKAMGEEDLFCNPCSWVFRGTV